MQNLSRIGGHVFADRKSSGKDIENNEARNPIVLASGIV
jgi:hypothetical protein